MNREDPHRITWAQLESLLDGLGLKTTDLNDVKSIHMEAGKVEVVRKRRNEDGKHYVVGQHDIATETVTIQVGA